jgi:hypothetical protein
MSLSRCGIYFGVGVMVCLISSGLALRRSIPGGRGFLSFVLPALSRRSKVNLRSAGSRRPARLFSSRVEAGDATSWISSISERHLRFPVDVEPRLHLDVYLLPLDSEVCEEVRRELTAFSPCEVWLCS